MPGNYSHTTRAAGTVLTASIYNTDHQNHVNNMTPAGVDDYSSSVAEMQTVRDPGEVGTEVLSTSLAEELQAIRNIITEIIGKTRWYQTPAMSLEQLNTQNTNFARRSDLIFTRMFF